MGFITWKAFGIATVAGSLPLWNFFMERKLWLGDAVENHIRLKEKRRELAKPPDKYSEMLTDCLRQTMFVCGLDKEICGAVKSITCAILPGVSFTSFVASEFNIHIWFDPVGVSAAEICCLCL